MYTVIEHSLLIETSSEMATPTSTHKLIYNIPRWSLLKSSPLICIITLYIFLKKKIWNELTLQDLIQISTIVIVIPNQKIFVFFFGNIIFLEWSYFLWIKHSKITFSKYAFINKIASYINSGALQGAELRCDFNPWF